MPTRLWIFQLVSRTELPLMDRACPPSSSMNRSTSVRPCPERRRRRMARCSCPRAKKSSSTRHSDSPWAIRSLWFWVPVRACPQRHHVIASSRADLPWPLAPHRARHVNSAQIQRRHVVSVAKKVADRQPERDHRIRDCITGRRTPVRSRDARPFASRRASRRSLQ